MKSFRDKLSGKITESDLRFSMVYQQNVKKFDETGDIGFLHAPFELWKATRCPEGLSETGKVEAYKSYLKRVQAVPKQ